MANNILVSLFFLMALSTYVDGLTMNHYKYTCPNVDEVVRHNVQSALLNDPTLAAGLIRMHFHDCFIQGCDGSVLIDSTEGNIAEKDAIPNLSLRGFNVIDEIKEDLEKKCPGVVSCADVLAMVARDAIFFAGGPVYEIPTGRKDGRRSKLEDTFNLPPPSFNATQLITMFGNHGFSTKEMVALSGAHTLGVARCATFKQRLTQQDPTLDSKFAKTLSKTCSLGDNAEQPFDATRNTFDYSYFNSLVSNKGVLFSDQTLYNSPQTRDIVTTYAINQELFFWDFQLAMVKLSLLNVKEGSKGEVRKICNKIN